MAKKILLLLSCVFCMQFAIAQSMSDEQIIIFVQAEQEKGSDQRTIATKLLQKGVSPERIREIKKKYDAEKSLLGANNLVGRNGTDSRLRDRAEETQKRQAGLVRSKNDITKRYSRDEKLGMLENEMAFLDIDSVLYYRNLLNEPRVFGRNIFNNELLTFESSSNVPTPSDYILGAGDVVIIDIWGASQALIESEISPDGKIVVDGVGPLHLAGKNVKEANTYLNEVLGKRYNESSISLSVGTTRSIVVQVLGEVVAPGSYTMSALSTAFNALYAAGGISDIGTLRSINVFRNGKAVAVIDVYDYIFNGKVDGNIRLQDNDVISVGVYDAIVNIQGKIKRPMLYEMKNNETLASLVKFSGGFAGDAYSEKLRVVRKSGREYSLFTVDRKNMGAFAMCDGDSIYVDSVIPRFSNMVEVNGAVFFPGQYQYGEDINSVSELLSAAGGLREDAFLNRAVLHHRNADNTIEAKSIDVKGIVNGTTPDVALRNNDILFIPSNSDMAGDLVVKVNGEVNFPGEYKFAENTTIEDIILQAGGLTRAASMAKIDVFRQIIDPSAMEDSDSLVETYSFKIKDGFVVDGESGFVLKPFDEINIRRSPMSNKIKNVQISGAVNFDGRYAITSNDFKLSDLVKVAGGFSNSAYVKGAHLSRKFTKEDLEQRDLLQTLSNVEMYEEMIDNSSDANFVLMDSLMKTKLGEGDLFSIAIDLEKAIENPGSDYDIVLRDGDVVTVPEYTSTVKIRGEVKYPTAVNWKEGKSLKYYIKHAGGFGNKAKKNGVYVINMNGSVEQISKHSRKAIQPGCEIVVPRKKMRKSVSTAEIVAIGSSTASLATMVVTLINLLK
ncbi:MAG: SLBB domain-containing protein [Bacteroidaceae bacterium]|nr:SLBB domain-containing protein [Bacteroidaceae bacterium]